MADDRRTAVDPAGAASLPGPASTLNPPPPTGRVAFDDAGVVVVLFGFDPGNDHRPCNLTRCPMGTAHWFPNREAAASYCDTVPDAFEPHILIVERHGA